MPGRQRETHRTFFFACICLLMMHLGPDRAHAQSDPSGGLTSNDYIRLMEEANAKRPLGSGLASVQQVVPNQVEVVPNHSPQPLPPTIQPAQQTIPLAEQTIPVAEQTIPVAPQTIPVAPQIVPLAPQTIAPAQQTIPGPAVRVQDAPHVSLAYESVWLRRTGDTSTTYSQGGELGTFGEDLSGLVRLGWVVNPMERYEFAYLGSLHWNRSLTSLGPIDGQLRIDPIEPNWLDNVNQSLQHDQVHSATMRCYEINHRWIADDLSNGFFGFHAIDYREAYSFTSNGNGGNARLDFDTSNLLAGMQGGMELWRPLSQRIAVGGQSAIGLYGNFADGEWNFQRGDGQSVARGDDSFQLAGAFGFDAKVRYQFTSRLQAFGSYRWWYLAGLATVDDQSVAPVGTSALMDLSTDAGFLLQGATCGLEVVF